MLRHLAAAAAVFFVAAASANALTYQWSFYSEFGSSEGFVTGTISGLSVGDNSGTGLAITVLSTPSGLVLGDGWTLNETDTPDVAVEIDEDFMVTFALLFFERDGGTQRLSLNTNPDFISPNLLLADGVPDAGGRSSLWFSEKSATFTLIPEPPATVPLPAGFPLLAAALAGLAGPRLRLPRTA